MSSYTEQTLTAGERIVHEGKFHWTHTFRIVVMLIFCAIFWIGANGWLHVGTAIFGWLALSGIIVKFTTEIVLTTDRLVIKTGWIARKTEELPVDKIEEVNVNQSMFGRIFGYGRLTVRGIGAGELKTPNIAKPIDYRRAILKGK